MRNGETVALQGEKGQQTPPPSLGDHSSYHQSGDKETTCVSRGEHGITSVRFLPHVQSLNLNVRNTEAKLKDI